jgi:hypothetical protein
MAVITERCIRLFELPDGTRPGSCGDTQEGGRPHVLSGSKPRKSPGAAPRLRPAAASAHVAEAALPTFSPGSFRQSA